MLLDSNVVIDLLRGSERAADFIGRCGAKPSLSVVSITELYAGALSVREERQIERIVRSSNVLPVTLEIARSAGQHVKHYQASNALDDFDALIAATAEHHGLPLATLNVKHFPMFPKLKPAY